MLRRIFSPKFKVFELDPRYFPEATRSLIPLEWVLRHGALPLGTKRKKINVGFLDPYSSYDFTAIEGLLEKKEIQRFEIKTDQLLVVLKTQYGISMDALQNLAAADLHPKIQKVLEEFP